METIHQYQDFCTALEQTGFTIGGENPEGIFTLCSWFGPEIAWHTEDPETDPWEWRMRVLDQRNDIAYAKVFFRKSGYITKEWYPYFLAARRGNVSLAEAYAAGHVGAEAKRIYELVAAEGAVPVHRIKLEGGFSKEDKSRFDRALTELQMGLYLTMCGRACKLSKQGEAYGWSSTVFCTTEAFWGPEVFDRAAGITPAEAERAVSERVLAIHPEAPPKKLKKFIYGR